MAEVDARIPMSYQFPQLPTGQSVEAYKQLQYRNQLAQMDITQAQDQQQQNNALMSILKQPGAMGSDGMPTQETVGKVMQVNPAAGMKLANSLAEMQEKRQAAITNGIHQKLLQLQINGNQSDELTKIATAAQVRYDDLVKSGTPPAEAARIAGQQRNKALQDAQDSGTLLEGQARSLQIPFDPEVNRALIAGSPQYTKILQSQEADRRAKVQEDREARLEQNDNTRTEDSGMDPFMKEAAARYGKGTPEYSKALEDHLAKETGGGGQGQGKMGSREAVYVNRNLSSAGLAMRDIGNIARGPTSQSSGWFGGRSQGPTIMDATKEQLANKMTSQEVQTYNVKIAGLQRNLATLESQGLAPSGSLTHQMDAIVFKEGDTNMTKAYKLAEARQIVEGALDVVVNSDRVDSSSKALASKILNQVKVAVPYSVEDLDAFSQSGKKSAKIGDFVKQKQSMGNAKDQVAHPKSKAEYDALPSGTRVVLPNGKEGVKP